MSAAVIDAPPRPEAAADVEDVEFKPREHPVDEGGVPDPLAVDPFDGRYEILGSEVVGLPPMATDSAVFANFLAFEMNSVAVPAGVGMAHVEVLFKLPLPGNRNRRPDLAFVPFAKWPRFRRVPRKNAWDVLPDLCVEVISPTDIAADVREKTDEYFRAGVKLVWVVYPRLELIDVYDSADACRTLRRADALGGGAVLPGFRVELATLFPDPEPEPT